jgi:hypothetical protein
MFQESPTPPGPAYGKGRIIDGKTSWFPRARDWYHHCRDSSAHQDCKPLSIWGDRVGSDDNGLNVFRVIDIQNNCIKRFRRGDHHSPYAALSYVIGPHGHPPRVLSSNIDDLEEDDGLATMSLPKTYSDAMEVTKKLGLQYLWVDSPCLVEGPDKEKGIRNMDRVYEGAAVTIIVAGGDRHTGIKCLHRDNNWHPLDRCLTTRSEMGGSWGYIQGLNVHLKDSDWVTRGWT